jgi:hypothetical protein
MTQMLLQEQFKRHGKTYLLIQFNGYSIKYLLHQLIVESEGENVNVEERRGYKEGTGNTARNSN